GAVDGHVLLVAGDEERDRALAVFFGLAAVISQIIEHRGDTAGDPALHVDRAAAVDKAVLYIAGERTNAPGRLIARRHHVRVAGEGDMRRAVSEPRIEIVDIGRAMLAEGDPMNLEAGCFQKALENTERAGIKRGYRGTADEIANNRKGIGHVLRLTCDGG